MVKKQQPIEMITPPNMLRVKIGGQSDRLTNKPLGGLKRRSKT